MRKIYLAIVSLFFLAHTSKGQLTTSQTLTPQQLVQNVLLGPGVTATNITFTGSPNARGKFTATASTNLGIGSGVILTSGTIVGSNNPSGSVNAQMNEDNGQPGDSDLDGIVSGTENAAILEFDFVPQSDTLSFKYVFASEEYPEYVCGTVNDIFAFLLSGPNPSGGNYVKHNVALIPGTTLPVTINSVNPGVTGSFGTVGGCLSLAYSQFYVNNQSPVNSQLKFDGMTKVLRAKASVICGQTYHIKIAIADVSDGIYDSGVFLEGGSFSSLPPLGLNTTNANSNIPDSILVEDCNTNCFNFIRNGNIANPDSFSLQVSGNALLGTDYIQSGNPAFIWPTKIYFAANQDTVKFCNLSGIQDGLVEGLDTIKFTMSSFVTNTLSCAATNTIRFNLYIKDYTPISISQNDVSLCSGYSTILNAGAGGGYPVYTYTISSPSVNTPTLNTGPVTSATDYTITVNDVCNKPITKVVTVTPVAIPTVVATNTISCGTSSVSVSASGATTYTWSTGLVSDTLNVNPSSTTNYTVVGANGTCTNSAVSTVSVVSQISITGNTIICLGESAMLTASGGSSYTWDTGETTTSIVVTPTTNTTYTLTSIVGSCTNTAIHTLSVTSNPTLTFSAPIVCPGQNATITVSGATTYTWSTGTVSNSITVNPTAPTSYTVTGTLNSSCTNTAVYTLTVVPTPTIIPTSTVICFGGIATLTASGASSYAWNTGSTSYSTTVSPLSTTNYTVVGSVGSCTSMAVATVTVINQTLSIIGNNNICEGQSTVLTLLGGSSLLLWSNGATTSTINVTPNDTTTYSVVSTLGACTQGTMYTVSVSPNPTISVVGTSICPGQNGVITASGATTYTWNTGATSNSIVVNSNINTTYTVIGTSPPSCVDTAIYTVSLITSQPVMDPVNPVVICLDSIKTVPIVVSSGNPPYQIDWLIPSNGITPYDTMNNTYYFMEYRTHPIAQYTVVATDQCSFKDTIIVSIEIIDCEVIIPNVITANGDGVNDYFKINGLENYSGSVLSVFNRWGKQVYNSDDYKNDWSPDENSGTYFYTLNLTDGRKFNGFFQVFKD
ncbi:MAG: domain containing protein [Bacteroidetes bacterium]|jgi:gliding motility-associated-like protein|nr:domain containing protein [Bacteroidota bacterium]